MTLEQYFDSWFLLHAILLALIGYLIAKIWEN